LGENEGRRYFKMYKREKELLKMEMTKKLDFYINVDNQYDQKYKYLVYKLAYSCLEYFIDKK
jgi:outer membrane receptor for monomeric catechols